MTTITFQLGVVAPAASVVYRFALAAAMLAAWCLATGASLRFPLRQHAWFAAQGTLLFGLNYLAVYRAEQYIASGLVAVLFLLVLLLVEGWRMPPISGDGSASASPAPWPASCGPSASTSAW